MFLIIFVVLLIFFPSKAYAYLDPGTGNVLVFAIISILTTLVYFIKNIAYGLKAKITGEKQNLREVKKSQDLVIFSEGKIYWGTFKPIVEALIKKEFPFRYMSMDVEDPGLTIENEHMDSSYIGSGSAAFARASQVRAKIMLETTPNIGTPGYPMPVPKHVNKLVHVLHGFGGIGYYYKNSLDTCDVVMGMSNYTEKEVRALEKKRNLPAKECISAGIPYLDGLAERIQKKDKISDPAIILVAPSWGEKNCLGVFGDDFIAWLLNQGYEVILRPHPFSFKAEKAFIESVKNKYIKNPKFHFDDAVSGSDSLGKADLLISDKSGVRFDFAFLYEKPVITLDVPLGDVECFEVADLGFCWDDEAQHSIGRVIDFKEFARSGEEFFLELVEESLSLDSSFFAELREKAIAHYPKSGEFIADWIIKECRESVAS